MDSRADSVRPLNTPPSSSSLLAGELELEMVKIRFLYTTIANFQRADLRIAPGPIL